MPGQRGAEAGEVGAALVRVDVVREREHGLDVGRVPLHRDLESAVVVLALEVDDVLVDRLLGVVDVGHEVLDPALGVELVTILALALVDERDPQATRQEGGLPESLHERLRREVELLEDLGVRQEGDRRAGVARRLPTTSTSPMRHAPSELLAVQLPVAADLGDRGAPTAR